MKVRILLVAAMMLAAGTVMIGCESNVVNAPTSQADFTSAGWEAWRNGQYDSAHEMFGNAYKMDDTYAEAYTGDGWTFFREEELNDAFEHFSNAELLNPADVDAAAGNSCVLLYQGYFTDSVDQGNRVISADGDGYVFAEDNSVSAFDVYMVMALDFMGLGNANNCCAQINNMRRIIGEAENFSSTDWQAIATEISRLSDLDPS